MSPNQTNYILAISGFIVANIFLYIFSGKFEGDKSESSIFVNLFNLSFHLHHWIIGLLGLIICLVVEQFIGRNLLLSFAKGLSVGLVFHGLTFYTDYFSIRR
jgi:hypothetical protein